MSQHRAPIRRDPVLAAEPIETVARRYRAGSVTGSITLAVVVIGLAIAGVAGAFAWSTSPATGIAVLLGGALLVGLVSGFTPPPVTGVRAIATGAVSITAVPVVLLAIGAVFTSGSDRAWALGALAVTSLGGAAMVALAVGGHLLARRFRRPPGGIATTDPITAAVLAGVRADLDRSGTPEPGRERVCSAPDDPAGRARLELETRLLLREGYREVWRERVTARASAALVAVDLVAGLGVPGATTRVAIEVGFAPPEPGSVPQSAPDPELAAAIDRWRQVRARGSTPEPAVPGPAAPEPAPGAVRDGPDNETLLVVAAIAALLLQGFGAAMLFGLWDAWARRGTAPDPLKVVVAVLLAVALPLVVSITAGARGGRRTWVAAIVPLIAAVTLAVALSDMDLEVLGIAAAIGGILAVPWAVGWLAGVGLHGRRSHRPATSAP